MPKGIYVRKVFKPIHERLLSKTIKTGYCWLWTGCVTKFGHGQIQTRKNGIKKLEATHRVSFELAYGEIPDGLFVLHKCDIPNCINPEHLFLGTKADNSKDMVSKKRQKSGVALPQAKLNDHLVNEIRKSNLNQPALSKKYGVSQPCISNIIHGKRWKHLL